MNCYCCSGKELENCCRPFIENRAKPATAEALMRSRYTAYVLAETGYLLRSTHPSTRKFYGVEDLSAWARANRWQRLEVIATEKGTAQDRIGTVEFKAYYLDADDAPRVHHEISNFRKELGKWFYVDGKVANAT